MFKLIICDLGQYKGYSFDTRINEGRGEGNDFDIFLKEYYYFQLKAL